jgi:hypothetical protein
MKASIFVRNWAVERWPESAEGEGQELGIELYLETGITIPLVEDGQSVRSDA